MQKLTPLGDVAQERRVKRRVIIRLGMKAARAKHRQHLLAHDVGRMIDVPAHQRQHIIAPHLQTRPHERHDLRFWRGGVCQRGLHGGQQQGSVGAEGVGCRRTRGGVGKVAHQQGEQACVADAPGCRERRPAHPWRRIGQQGDEGLIEMRDRCVADHAGEKAALLRVGGVLPPRQPFANRQNARRAAVAQETDRHAQPHIDLHVVQKWCDRLHGIRRFERTARTQSRRLHAWRTGGKRQNLHQRQRRLHLEMFDAGQRLDLNFRLRRLRQSRQEIGEQRMARSLQHVERQADIAHLFAGSQAADHFQTGVVV